MPVDEFYDFFCKCVEKHGYEHAKDSFLTNGSDEILLLNPDTWEEYQLAVSLVLKKHDEMFNKITCT